VTSVRLTSQPDNPHDRNAVAVQTFGGETLGYLSREDAPRYQPLILQLNAEGVLACAQGKLYGGTRGKPHIGLYLDVAGATIVAEDLGLKYRRVRRKAADA
jgi:hypothetical protein